MTPHVMLMKYICGRGHYKFLDTIVIPCILPAYRAVHSKIISNIKPIDKVITVYNVERKSAKKEEKSNASSCCVCVCACVCA